MKRWQIVVAALVAAGVIVGVAGAAFVWFTGGSGEASEPISAPTLVVVQSTPTESPEPTATEAPTATQAPATKAPTATPVPTTKAAATATAAPTPQATQAAPTSTPVQATPTVAASEPEGEKVLFRLVQAESRVRFEIDEILRGEPFRVIGVTDQVAGDLIIDFASPQDSQLGTLRINARTLQTDDGRRDRAIRSRILQSAEDAYEFIEFVPTSLVGLPSGVAIGDEIQFTIVGTLTIREISAEITFDAVVSIESDSRVSGSAVTTIQRATYDLTIPSVPFVASVGEDVLLAIDFAAERVEQ
ncbi:MAG: YceI family protein [Chloroflexi bacterium]|nr:YceI family protein [Chloroflexota bacterium]MCY3938103.1 YceI family protein [Chloroflexota bacterium]